MTIDALRLQDLGAVGSIYSRSVASRRISDAPAATATAAAWYPPLTREPVTTMTTPAATLAA